MAERKGPGRWTICRTPKGVLWESATGIGFEALPGETPLAINADFTTLAAAHGTKVITGNLDTWNPTP